MEYNKAIQNFINFLDRQHQRGKISAFYWVLVRGVNLNKNRSADTTIEENRDIADYEESKALLLEAIETAYVSGETHLHVRIYDKDTLKTVVLKQKITFKKNTSSNTGLGNLNASNTNLLLHFMKSNEAIAGQFNQQQLAFSEFKKDQKIEELKDEVAYWKDNRKNIWEKAAESIQGFAETPEGVGKFLDVVKTGMETIQMFKNPAGALNGMNPQQPQLSEADKAFLSLRPQLDQIHEDGAVNLLGILLYYGQHKPDKFKNVIAHMLEECKQIEANGNV